MKPGARTTWSAARYKTIAVWRPGDAVPHQILRPGNDLDGGAVLRGFRYPVATAFKQQ